MCSTGRGTPNEVAQCKLRETLCSTSFSLCSTPSTSTVSLQAVLYTTSLYFTPSACVAHPHSTPVCTVQPQPSLYCTTRYPNLYCSPPACTAHYHSVLLTFRLHCTPSASTVHGQPVLYTPTSVCTAHP